MSILHDIHMTHEFLGNSGKWLTIQAMLIGYALRASLILMVAAAVIVVVFILMKKSNRES